MALRLEPLAVADVEQVRAATYPDVAAESRFVRTRAGIARAWQTVCRSMKLISLVLLLASTATSAAAAPCSETDKTAASVKCVEDHWQAAFIGGDEKFLMQLLSEGYHSYTPAGVGRDRAAIVALAKSYAAKHRGEPAPASSGPAPDIQLRGDVAVVFWPAADHALGSVDAFYWADGRWHAWYSQHAGVTK